MKRVNAFAWGALVALGLRRVASAVVEQERRLAEERARALAARHLAESMRGMAGGPGE